jgi:hypothetical protein
VVNLPQEDEFIVDLPEEKPKSGFFQRVSNTFRVDPTRKAEAERNKAARSEKAKELYNRFQQFRKDARHNKIERLKDKTQMMRYENQYQKEVARHQHLKQQQRQADPMLKMFNSNAGGLFGSNNNKPAGNPFYLGSSPPTQPRPRPKRHMVQRRKERIVYVYR